MRQIPGRLDCPNEKHDQAPMTPLYEVESFRRDETP